MTYYMSRKIVVQKISIKGAKDRNEIVSALLAVAVWRFDFWDNEIGLFVSISVQTSSCSFTCWDASRDLYLLRCSRDEVMRAFKIGVQPFNYNRAQHVICWTNIMTCPRRVHIYTTHYMLIMNMLTFRKVIMLTTC